LNQEKATFKKREKVFYVADKNAVAIRGSTWTLWVSKVKTKDGDTFYALKPLETKYNPQTHEFHSEPIKATLWLKKQEMDKLITNLIQLSEEK